MWVVSVWSRFYRLTININTVLTKKKVGLTFTTGSATSPPTISLHHRGTLDKNPYLLWQYQNTRAISPSLLDDDPYDQWTGFESSVLCHIPSSVCTDPWLGWWRLSLEKIPLTYWLENHGFPQPPHTSITRWSVPYVSTMMGDVVLLKFRYSNSSIGNKSSQFLLPTI